MLIFLKFENVWKAHSISFIYLEKNVERRHTIFRKYDARCIINPKPLHVGIQGNELADTLAKEATTDQDIPICYDKIPKSVFKSELERISVENWQKIWNQTTKVNITKAFFPRVEERLNMKLHTNQALTTILTGHGNIKALSVPLQNNWFTYMPLRQGRPTHWPLYIRMWTVKATKWYV